MRKDALIIMFDIELTRHLAQLSKFNFSEEQLKVMSDEMADIVALMDTVSEFESDEKLACDNAVGFEDLREDKVVESFERESILQNAKGRGETYFKVPKVV
ncbi:MAG: Asp-tRNA(Asn)/Glu-tRNA(Gln) amidotransferase subunit GatC [bacterium]|nr:Asp-tRNA(Asn)/Glu-tRNA(Gln) amidotransferase subunit GatC [bacterium]